jgi:hypothetical protein
VQPAHQSTTAEDLRRKMPLIEILPAARCVSCGRLTSPGEIGAGVEGFAPLCYCQQCEQERRQTELELVEVTK